MNPMWELLWLRSWQYGCVRFNLATAKKKGCATSYGCAPGNMVAFVKYACQKNGCATSCGCAPGNMVASVNLATAKKMVA